MPPRPKPLPVINTHIIPTPNQPIIKKQKPTVSGPTTILPPKLPNSTPIPIPKPVIIPTSATPYSNSPNIQPPQPFPNTISGDTKPNQDNTMTYVIIGAIVVGFLILKNKDI